MLFLGLLACLLWFGLGVAWFAFVCFARSLVLDFEQLLSFLFAKRRFFLLLSFLSMIFLKKNDFPFLVGLLALLGSFKLIGLLG